MSEPFLRADQGQNLRVGVEIDVVSFFAKGRDRAPQLGRSLVEGILMECRVLDMVLQALDNRLWGRAIGVADSEVDHVAARGDGGLLLLVDLRKQIRGKLSQPFRFHELLRSPSQISLSIAVIRGVKYRPISISASSLAT